MRKIKWVALVCGLLALAWASDSTMAGDNGSVVQQDGQGDAKGTEGEVTDNEDQEIKWATVTWNLDGKYETSDKLSMTVQSESDEDLVLTVGLYFHGLATTESLDLGEYELSAGQTIIIDVLAGEIPIQNLNGATIVTTRIQGTVVSTGESEGQISIPSPGIFYRFNDQSYQTLTVFTRQALEEDFRGVMFDGGSAAVAPESIVLGRVKKNGKLEKIKADDEKFTVKKNGKIEARLLSEGIVVWANMTEEQRELEEHHEQYMETKPDRGEEP
jgi:hypothetical protein